MDSKKAEFILLSKWSGSIGYKDAEEKLAAEIGELTIKDLLKGDIDRDFLEGKRIYKCLVLAAAFLCAEKCTEEEIYELIVREEYRVQRLRLLSSLEYVLCGKDKNIKLAVGWTYDRFPSKYAWVSRFFGEFCDRNLEEIIRISRVLYKLDPERIWKIAKKEPDDLLLLNYERLTYDGEKLPLDYKLELFEPEQSEVRHALGFFWITDMAGKWIKDEKAEDIISILKGVDEKILLRCLYEFMLEEHVCPEAFLKYILKPSRNDIFRKEFQREELIMTWNDVNIVAEILSHIRDKRRKGLYFRQFRRLVIKKIGRGDLTINVRKGLEFLKQLPPDELKLFVKDLEDIESKLHAEYIDSMIRQRLFLADSRIKQTIVSLKEMVEEV